MRFWKLIFPVLLVLWSVPKASLAAPPEWCKQRILAMGKGGPGWGYLLLPDVEKEVATWARKGLVGSKNSVFFGNIFICDSCGRPNGSKDRTGKYQDCKGCGHPIDKKTQVHKIFTQGGVRLAHLESAFYAGDSLGDIVATPWDCAYCDTKNEAANANCKKCGSDPYAGRAKDAVGSPLPFGVDLMLIPDSAEIDGYRLEKRVGPTEVVMRRTGQVLSSLAAPAAPYARQFASRTAPYVAPYVNPVVDVASHMSRRQWFATASAAVGLSAAATWWALQPYVPNLPATHWVSGVVVERHMFRQLKIAHKKDEGIVWLDPKFKDYHAVELEPLSAPELIDFPEIEPEIAQNTREYRVFPHEEHYLMVRTADYIARLPMAPSEIAQWRVGDRVKLQLSEGGTEVGLRRELQ